MIYHSLVDEYRRLEACHRRTLVRRAARLVLGGSVIRVLDPGADHDVLSVLVRLRVDTVPTLVGQEGFRRWFERALRRVSAAIIIRNADSPRVHPGCKWGHGTKILTLFLRELVMSSRCFSDTDAERIAPWLYTPLDRIALNRLSQLGYPNGIHAIKHLDSARVFYRIQDDLSEAAARVGVPRIWFDDVWAGYETGVALDGGCLPAILGDVPAVRCPLPRAAPGSGCDQPQ